MTLLEAIQNYEDKNSARVGGDGLLQQAKDQQAAVEQKLTAATATTAAALASDQALAQAEFDALALMGAAVDQAKSDLAGRLPAAPVPTV